MYLSLSLNFTNLVCKLTLIVNSSLTTQHLKLFQSKATCLKRNDQLFENERRRTPCSEGVLSCSDTSFTMISCVVYSPYLIDSIPEVNSEDGNVKVDRQTNTCTITKCTSYVNGHLSAVCIRDIPKCEFTVMT